MEEPGPCRAYFERWYFDRDARQCRPFGYGGCRGNRNNFHSLTECNTVCAGVKGERMSSRPAGSVPTWFCKYSFFKYIFFREAGPRRDPGAAD